MELMLKRKAFNYCMIVFMLIIMMTYPAGGSLGGKTIPPVTLGSLLDKEILSNVTHITNKTIMMLLTKIMMIIPRFGLVISHHL